jgi:hypothetical protein
MKKRLRRWLYYRFARLSVKAKWSRNKLPELTKVQEDIMKITFALIADNESELLINPTYDERVGEKYYIKKTTDSGEIEKFITISKTSSGYMITVVGHEIIADDKYNYHYDTWFNETVGRMIVEKFTRVIRRRRNKMESEMRKGDEKVLELIIKKLQHKR